LIEHQAPGTFLYKTGGSLPSQTRRRPTSWLRNIATTWFSGLAS
jgi:hypothetical protein